MYIVANTAIFLVVRLLLLRYNYMFRPSMLVIFRLYMRNLSISYTNMCGEFTVCGVGWVRDLVLCWIKGVWTGAVLGIVLKYHSCLLSRHEWYFNTIPKTAPVHTPFIQHKTSSRTHPTPQTVNSPHMLV